MTNKLSREEQKQIAFIILKATDHLQTGRNNLALFLRGSHSKIVRDKELDRKAGYGALLWQDIPTITGFINQLDEMGLIKSYLVQNGRYSYPILTLTEAGKKALEEKIELPLQIRKVIKPITIGESERETLSLFKSGCQPQEIAQRRSLAISTIFGHLYKLILVGEVEARQYISKDVIKKVLQAKEQANKSSLKELKLILPEEITYEEIKAVLVDKTIQNETQQPEDN